jgi:hypothetical protein
MMIPPYTGGRDPAPHALYDLVVLPGGADTAPVPRGSYADYHQAWDAAQKLQGKNRQTGAAAIIWEIWHANEVVARGTTDRDLKSIFPPVGESFP